MAGDDDCVALVIASVSKFCSVVSLLTNDDGVLFITLIVSLLLLETELFDVEPNVQTTKATPNSIENFRIIFEKYFHHT